MKFRKKPIEIEAIEFDGTEDNARHIATEFKVQPGQMMYYPPKGEFTPHMDIRTLEGVFRANAGDWIIKDVNGEYYPCKSEIFEKTYDRVDEK